MNLQGSIPGYVIIILFALMVVAINVSLFTAIRNRSKANNRGLLRSNLDILRSPWKGEDQQLEDLSQMVSKFSDGKEIPTVAKNEHERRKNAE